MFIRILFFIFSSLALINCREIILFENEENITGYQINGMVSTASGSPIESVKVYLSYENIKISSTPLDTFDLYISDPNINVVVNVHNISDEFIVNIFSGKLPVGPVQRFKWNGELDSVNYAPSGYYKIRVYFNNQIVKEYPIIVEGNLTAISNKKGEFFIYNKNLPVGKLFDKYDHLNRYLGTFKILESVLLELEYRSFIKRGYVNLTYNKITKVNVTL